MNRQQFRHRNWNEFQWEREIRRDERRISCYFRELVGCLDLPGEEEMIYDQLANRPDLVPHGMTMDAPTLWQGGHDEDDEDDEGERQPRRADSAMVDEADLLASEWNIIAASSLRGDLSLHGLGVCCAYGKLLARLADYADADEHDELALKLSLAKRSLNDLNELTGALRILIGFQASLEPELTMHCEQLGQLRERLFDRLEELRHPERSDG